MPVLTIVSTERGRASTKAEVVSVARTYSHLVGAGFHYVEGSSPPSLEEIIMLGRRSAENAVTNVLQAYATSVLLTHGGMDRSRIEQELGPEHSKVVEEVMVSTLCAMTHAFMNQLEGSCGIRLDRERFLSSCGFGHILSQ